MRPSHPKPRANRAIARPKSAERPALRSSQPPAARLPEPGRRQLLTHEEEIAQAKSIERAEQALVEAIADSPPALRKLGSICEEVRGGTLELAELIRDPTDAEQAPEQIAKAILDAADAAAKPGTARKHFIRTVLEYRLGRRAADAIVLELEALARSERPDKAAVAATAAAIRDAQQKAEHARSVLTQANLGLVLWMARRRGPQGLPAADLIQEGNLGLMRAVEKFDYRRGFRFNTYASWWIRHFMNRALSDQSRVIRLPVHLLETRHRVLRRAQNFLQQHGREPTLEELAKETDTPIEKVSDILQIPPQPASLDAPIRSDGDARRGDFVADDRATSPVDVISSKEIQGRLREMLRVLTPREQDVLAHRFGMHGIEGVTLEQIGKRYSLSRERVRQIESEALAKLRKQAEKEDLASHLSG